MALSVAPLYAALLGFLLVYLSIRVIRLRRRLSDWQGERICTDCKHSGTWRDGEGWLPGDHRNNL